MPGWPPDTIPIIPIRYLHTDNHSEEGCYKLSKPHTSFSMGTISMHWRLAEMAYKSPGYCIIKLAHM